MFLFSEKECQNLRNELSSKRKLSIDNDNDNEINANNKNDNLFEKLFYLWSFNPFTAVLLTMYCNYFELSYYLALELSKIKLQENDYIELCQIVQIFESSLFNNIRIKLLRPKKNIFLVKTLYALLMMLPQSNAFDALNNRIKSVKIISYFDEDEDEDDFYKEFGGYGFNNNYPSRKNYSNYYYVIEEEDSDGNKRKYISDKPLDNDPKKIKKCVENWRKIADGLRDSQGIYILQTIGNVIKAVTILEKCEKDKNYDKKISIIDKLKLYKTLEENERIINFLSSGHKKNNKNISLEEDDVYDDDEEEEESLVCDEHPEKITDLAELKTKMESIEDYLKKKNLDKTKREKLEKLYDLYNQQKNILIENETESNKKEVISNNKINYHNLIKEEEKKRNMEIEAEQDRIKELNTIAQNALFSGIKDIIKTVSIRDRPTPNKIYKNQKIPTSGKPFTDTLFPPEKKSLCPINRNGSWILPKECIDDDVYGWEDIKWARVSEIFDSDNFQVFEDKIEADDIMQGSLGDCYFLSAIGSLCRFTNLIEKLFYFKEKSKENCYGVYLFINGIWELILIDDYMPYLGSYFKNFAFSSTTKNELWVMLLEKAWAKINGCYAKAGSGGTPTKYLRLSQRHGLRDC
jgi:hypothetical protein